MAENNTIEEILSIASSVTDSDTLNISNGLVKLYGLRKLRLNKYGCCPFDRK